MKPRTALRRISTKKLSSLDGKYVGSTITGKRKAIKKKSRKPSEFRRIYHSKERVEFVKELQCVCRAALCLYPSDNAHIEGDGSGRKADYVKIVPMCRFHHDALHHEGVIWVERNYGIDLDRCAAETQAAWLSASLQ